MFLFCFLGGLFLYFVVFYLCFCFWLVWVFCGEGGRLQGISPRSSMKASFLTAGCDLDLVKLPWSSCYSFRRGSLHNISFRFFLLLFKWILLSVTFLLQAINFSIMIFWLSHLHSPCFSLRLKDLMFNSHGEPSHGRVTAWSAAPGEDSSKYLDVSAPTVRVKTLRYFSGVRSWKRAQARRPFNKGDWTVWTKLGRYAKGFRDKD